MLLAIDIPNMLPSTQTHTHSQYYSRVPGSTYRRTHSSDPINSMLQCGNPLLVRSCHHTIFLSANHTVLPMILTKHFLSKRHARQSLLP